MSIASQLNQRVRIEYLAVADDGYGGKTGSWTELATVFAAIEPVYSSVGEEPVGDQLQARAGYRVKMRYRGDVDAAMRILWKSHILTIHSLHEAGELLNILTYEEDA
jgi:SPP1 family predicted phage head-tail adaptor